jgi:hypothetical protein
MRDLGAFFFWAPSKIRERFAMLVKDGYKDRAIMECLLFEHLMVRLHKKANRNLHVVTGLVILSCWKSNY